MSKEIKKDLNDDEQPTKIYPVLETTIPIPSTIPSAQNGVPQAAVRYINHSRNASSVSRNSRNAVTFAVQPPNKPDAVDSLLKIIGLRSNYEKSKEKKICFVRITSTGQFEKNYIIPLHHSFGNIFVINIVESIRKIARLCCKRKMKIELIDKLYISATEQVHACFIGERLHHRTRFPLCELKMIFY